MFRLIITFVFSFLLFVCNYSTGLQAKESDAGASVGTWFFPDGKEKFQRCDREGELNNKNKYAIRVGGYFQAWYIYEEVENDQEQRVTGDRATDEASGFSLNRARFYVSARVDGFNAFLSLMMERGTPGLLDVRASYSFLNKMIQIWIGQMKIPSTYEIADSSSSLDFITRSRLSSLIADWSLSKSTSSISPFTGVKSYNRDLGFALKGDIYGAHYFFMVGNGLGGNLYVGGKENTHFIYANSFGAYFYAVRLSWDIMETVEKITKRSFILSSLEIGGHFNWNEHNNVLYQDTKTVLDIKRHSWSVDGQVVFVDRIYLTVMYAEGEIEDDFDFDNKPDYVYSGLEAKIVVEIVRDWFQAGFRYDYYISENSIYGDEETEHAYTLGLTFNKKPYVRIQANYKFKILESGLNKDVDDNIFNLQFQLKF